MGNDELMDAVEQCTVLANGSRTRIWIEITYGEKVATGEYDPREHQDRDILGQIRDILEIMYDLGCSVSDGNGSDNVDIAFGLMR